METDTGQRLRLADNGKRFLAYLIDILPITILVLGIYYFFLGFDETWNAYRSPERDLSARAQFLKERNWIRNFSLLIWIVYCIFMEASAKQATFGKHAMKIIVADAAGNQLSLEQSIKRNASKVLSYLVLLIGFLWILFDKNRQGWHDKIAQTYVLNRDETSSDAEQLI